MLMRMEFRLQGSVEERKRRSWSLRRSGGDRGDIIGEKEEAK